MVLGDDIENQIRIARLINEEDPISYEKLKEKVDLSKNKFQKVIRNLRDNGVIEDSRKNKWYYSIASENIIEEVYGETDQYSKKE